MVYQGSKARLKKYIVPILQKCIDDNGVTNYVEPFVGGANIIDSIKCKRRIGTDTNIPLITLLQYIQQYPTIDIAPEECSFEHYKEVRKIHKRNYEKIFSGFGKYYFPKQLAYEALIGYLASYGGRFFDGGFGRDSKGGRSIYKERLANLRKQAPLLKDIEFYAEDYNQFLGGPCFYENCVFYLDPPYVGTKKYPEQVFNHKEFYDFCRYLAKDNWVFISEYSMPDDFECIWEKERKVLQKSNRTKGDVVTEKLFKVKGGR